MLGVLFALSALGAGWGVCRLLRCDASLAPSLGLAVLAVLATACIALGVPILVALGGVFVLLIGGLGRDLRQHKPGATGLALAVAAAIPALILGIALAPLDTPISNHDGAFHVETIDALRRGQFVPGWYPIGFHTAVAAVLGLTPNVNTARAVLEATQGLTILAPLAVFGLARRLGATPFAAVTAAVIQSLTFLYPYDFHLWGGWPLGMGVLLALGVWTVALLWLDKPRAPLAVAGGILLGGIVLTHGTELYTTALGLVVIVLVRRGEIIWRALGRDVPLAGGIAVVVALSYLPRLLDWAQSGGATSVGVQTLESTVPDPSLQGAGLWVQVGLGVVGASSFVDFPVRVALIVIGLRQPCSSLTRALWLTFAGVLVVFAAIHMPVTDRLYAVTFPWLADQRLLQIATIFGSILAGRGLEAAFVWLQRRRLELSVVNGRRALIAALVIAAFFAEGGVVSIFKRFDTDIANDVAFTSDDRAAMAWLRANAPAGALVANDFTADAGLWAPYFAGLPIVLSRTALEIAPDARQALLGSIAQPGAACTLGARYVYYGSKPYGQDRRHFDLDVLEASSALREVFRGGGAVIFEPRC